MQKKKKKKGIPMVDACLIYRLYLIESHALEIEERALSLGGLGSRGRGRRAMLLTAHLLVEELSSQPSPQTARTLQFVRRWD